MRNKILMLGFFLFAITFTMQAQIAQPAPVKIKKKKYVQNGIKKGTITKAEAVKIKKDKRTITVAKKRAKADGVVTPKERLVIRKKQQKANHTIFRAANNRKVRKH